MIEDKPNAAIISFFMNNIDMKTVDLQHKVVEKLNPSKYPHYSINTDLRHGASMDLAWMLNGVNHPTFKGQDIPKRFDHDIIFFLDIDAIPLNDKAIDLYVRKAAEGKLVGNVQRSNHIQNNQHLFVAPSALACSVDTFVSMGRPTALEISRRSDVAEEYTFAAEKASIPVEVYMPLRYDGAPHECESWALQDGMPVYGRGTTFGGMPYEASGDITAKRNWNPINGANDEGELFWHSFQIFYSGQQEKFHKKCEEVLSQ